jgi:hypothetical protein
LISLLSKLPRQVYVIVMNGTVGNTAAENDWFVSRRARRLHTLLGMRQPTSARAADTGSTARQIESADPPDDATGTARPAPREKDSLIGLITRSAAEEYVDLLVSKGG